MPDAPICSTHHVGHAPFFLRVRSQQQDTGRLGRLVAVDGDLVTLVHDDTATQYWTHPGAAQLLATALGFGVNEGVMYGDIFILDGYSTSLVDPSEATPCFALEGRTESAVHPRTISTRTGGPWQPGDELAKRDRDSDES